LYKEINHYSNDGTNHPADAANFLTITMQANVCIGLCVGTLHPVDWSGTYITFDIN